MTDTGPKVRADVLAVPAYSGTELPDPAPGEIKLNSNENLFGPSPKVDAAIRAEVARGHLHYYPAIEARDLNEALIAHFGLAANSVLTMGGGELVLPSILQSYVDPGAQTLSFDDGFPKYRNYSLMAGAEQITVPREGDAVAQILAAVTPQTQAVLIDNPGNPSGRLLPIEQLRALREALRPDILLVLDEAYVEFSDFGDAGLALAQDRKDVLVVRTFSKAYALAGLRIGWMTGHPGLIAPLRRVVPSFPISRPSMAAALAALDDQAHLKRNVAEMRRLRNITTSRLNAAGWQVGPCEGNFVLIQPGQHSVADLNAAFDTLTNGGVLVRPLPDVRGQPALRMTIGRAEDMARVWGLLGI
ncbi:MAG: histidinol-phosphate aminotransferase family protein [Rhodobacteraceae bacterium]|nr:histidinol-phosphate aminotransferase family protein [Paracoccaceae bacterium]